MDILDEATLIRRELERRLTPDHVDQHLTRGELAIAAGFYALHSADAVKLERLPMVPGRWELMPKGWPEALHPSFWHPSAMRRRLVAYSVALLAMEADRLERARVAAAAQRGAA